jgi:hypothetical protein
MEADCRIKLEEFSLSRKITDASYNPARCP